jgi:hypothetical protein
MRGERRTAQLETANGYRLTADGTIMAMQYLLTNAPRVLRIGHCTAKQGWLALQPQAGG